MYDCKINFKNIAKSPLSRQSLYQSPLLKTIFFENKNRLFFLLQVVSDVKRSCKTLAFSIADKPSPTTCEGFPTPSTPVAKPGKFWPEMQCDPGSFCSIIIINLASK